MIDEESKKNNNEANHWLDEIFAAKKRDKDYRKNGREVIDIYNSDSPDKVPFNVLFSNTETLLPALFSNSPRPVVQRRIKDENPVSKAASLAGQRTLEYLMDTNYEGYETFEQAMRSATLDALLPGRGITCVKYDASLDGDIKESEQCSFESKGWDRVVFGAARKWSKVPWIAFEEYIDREESDRLFGEAISKVLNFSESESGDDSEESSSSPDGEDESRKMAVIYQIWDRAGGKMIRYVSPGYDGYLKDPEDDPIGLTGFFPCPKPLQFIERVNDITPISMYSVYQNQAKELNKITARLSLVIDAIKVRGIYDSSLGDEIENLLSQTDNVLVPTDKSASLLSDGGLDKAIWLWPLEKLVNVANTLILARQQSKQVIYEITGISDILRGASSASESATAQEIKNEWGTLRLKRQQREVSRYARDLLRITMEVAASKFSDITISAMSGMKFPSASDKSQAQMVMAAAKSGAIDPNSPIIKQASEVASQPSWDEILGLLRDDTARSWQIDIETNSTVDLEATEDKKNMSEVMNAMAQFMNGIAPMVKDGVLPFEAAKTMLLTIVRRFRFGVEVEDQIKTMVAPNQQDGKAQADAAKVQADQQSEAQKHQREVASMEATERTEMAKLQAQQQADSAKMQFDREIEAMRLKSQAEIAERTALIQQQTEIKKITLQTHGQIKTSMMQADPEKFHKELTEDESRIRGEVEELRQVTSSVTDVLETIMASIDALAAQISAPVEYRRGRNGKVTSIKKGNRVISINRDRDSKIIGAS